MRGHEVEWRQIEIHQIDVAAVGMIDDLKILERQNRLCRMIFHRNNFTYEDVQILKNEYCSYQQRCIDGPMKGRC